MQRTFFRASRQLLAVALAFGLVVATAAPSGATYCLRKNDQYIVCVDP